jgi:pyruvate dehydrogenase E1 component alpha subunit
LSPTSETLSVENVSSRAASYGIPGITVDGQDVELVHEAVGDAVTRARRGGGPSLVETKTYRFENHAIGLRAEDDRDPAEVEHWTTQRDPLVLYRQTLTATGFDPSELDAIECAVADEITAALKFARSSPPPPPEAAYTHLFTNPIPIAL